MATSMVSGAQASLPDQTVTDQGLQLLCQGAALSSAEIDALRKSAIFADVIEFTLEYCPEVAALLTDGATSVLPGSAPAAAGK
ncbi:hypothetical protein OEW28_10140 [Defluviimonas sp. WL0002]|uniref:Uncharacterized protein n=1 Tax=Albidovulum marisflavi TaxID=2984159 RepID=A0ABT2ZCW7_9RHOB|nr:hypothetical protein [Defluviimonas sp. WL0002]MCV2868988.1 hypothetical protein [Defluviimonas sp. WL0002]